MCIGIAVRTSRSNAFLWNDEGVATLTSVDFLEEPGSWVAEWPGYRASSGGVCPDGAGQIAAGSSCEFD